MMSDISIRHEGDIAVVVPVGEMDAVASPELADVIDGLLGERPARGIVVDLAKVSFCDSRCIGVLVAAYRQARDLGVGLRTAEPQQQVNRLFVISGIDQIIPVEATVDEAVGALSG